MLGQNVRDGENGNEDKVAEVERELDVWGDKYCTKHLMYALVELVVVRLLPELGSKSVRELMAERLGGADGGDGIGGRGTSVLVA